MAKYLLKEGAKLTITDLRTEEQLKKVMKKLPKNINYVLGKNRISDIKKADIIILNPAVSNFSPLVKKIKELKKEYYNDYAFFLKNLEKNNPKARIIGITGTRGKTTVSTWTKAFIDNAILGGNIPEAALFKIQNKKTDVFILELSSFQLEHLSQKDRSPNIAILTNIYIDHLNRYKTYDRYSRMKKLIYANQTKNDYLILNNDEKTTKEIEKDKPKSQIYYISQKKLPKNKSGIYTIDNDAYFKIDGLIKRIGSISSFAPHEKTNFMFAALGAHLYGISWGEIFKKVKGLENPLFRQQIIFNNKGLKIINDSAGTNPDATIAAIEKYKNENLYLITGGTDKELDSKELAKKIAKEINPKKLFLLSGSATNNLVNNLPANYLKTGDVRGFGSLEEIIKTVSKEIKNGVIVFSPGAASFEKFKNEFDRGNQFNKFIKKYFE